MRRAYADTCLGQIHYATWGDASNPTLVLLPQGGRSVAMYKELAAELDAEFHLVAIDYPGSGWSDPLRDGTSFGEIGAAFIDLLDTLGLREVALYGHHTGNKIGTAMAAAFPERIRRFVLVGQSHSIVADNSRRGGTVGKTKRKLLEAADEREAALVQWADLFSVISSRWWDEGLVRDFDNAARRSATILKVADELMSAESAPALYRANFAYDLERDLRRIEAPTLIIEIASPSEDRAIGRQGDHLLEIMKRAQLAVLEEPDWHGNTMEHRAADLARLLRTFLEAPASPG
ncbi:alpha/beta hydrolase [Bosea sp. (in: a-proteobacteria)]|uniref:alpha/beta fold hydrolase n=1 Tax=Bosea sp. (in: a-proteobacteria) TaxID=1871050 RepID=UPI00261CE0FC|nr:alpha/beta hydrolase [Bosea sp. (in: a-proteobacteria)]MCO5089581.1 alpha/beta hydrolase [Bosea sp. (in: a-proteobacteria)]